MSTTASPSKAYLDALKVVDRYKTQGATRAESDAFIRGAIDEIDNDNGTLSDNVGEVGKWAVEIDEAFDRVTRGLTNLVADYGSEFPPLKDFLSEWKGYNDQWVSHLSLSRDVASAHVAVLKRFDQVFLELVATIQTDQDRLDVIEELGSFASEEHDSSNEMSQGFLNLKTQIEAFVIRFDTYVTQTGEELAERATQLAKQIEELKALIADLDNQIADATTALLASAQGAETMVGIIGLVVAGSVLAVLVAERVVKTVELLDAKTELADVNKQQQGLANIKSEFDGLRPDIALICAKLVLFAEIWNSVRNQTVHFQEQLRLGMETVDNERFKLEIELARKLCTPLIDGLTKYAEQLVNRPSK